MEQPLGASEILAANLKALLKNDPLGQVAAAKAMSIGTGTFRRAIGADEGGVNVSTLDPISAYLKCAPYQLLIPKEKLLSVTQLDGFEGQLIGLFRRLSDDQKHEVLVHVNEVLDKNESKPSPASPFKGKRQAVKGK